MHKALIGFDINEYPEIEIFQKYFECDFCEYSEDYFNKNISQYSILVPHLYLKLTHEHINKASNLKYIFTPSTGIIFFSNLVSMSLGKLGLVDIGVSIEAGHTQLTFNPLRPYSTARVLENALMPPLDAL